MKFQEGLFSFLLVFGALFTAVTLFSIIAPKEVCAEPLLRVEYVFPARSLGCWLGSVPGGE